MLHITEVVCVGVFYHAVGIRSDAWKLSFDQSFCKLSMQESSWQGSTGGGYTRNGSHKQVHCGIPASPPTLLFKGVVNLTALRNMGSTYHQVQKRGKTFHLLTHSSCIIILSCSVINWFSSLNQVCLCTRDQLKGLSLPRTLTSSKYDNKIMSWLPWLCCSSIYVFYLPKSCLRVLVEKWSQFIRTAFYPDFS